MDRSDSVYLNFDSVQIKWHMTWYVCTCIWHVGRHQWHPDEDIWFEITYVVIKLSAVMIYLNIMCTLMSERNIFLTLKNMVCLIINFCPHLVTLRFWNLYEFCSELVLNEINVIFRSVKLSLLRSCWLEWRVLKNRAWRMKCNRKSQNLLLWIFFLHTEISYLVFLYT